jgi:hypothetical protein
MDYFLVSLTKLDRIHVGCCCPETKLQFLYDILKPGGIVVVRTNSGALQDSATIAVNSNSPLFSTELIPYRRLTGIN